MSLPARGQPRTGASGCAANAAATKAPAHSPSPPRPRRSSTGHWTPPRSALNSRPCSAAWNITDGPTSDLNGAARPSTSPRPHNGTGTRIIPASVSTRLGREHAQSSRCADDGSHIRCWLDLGPPAFHSAPRHHGRASRAASSCARVSTVPMGHFCFTRLNNPSGASALMSAPLALMSVSRASMSAASVDGPLPE